MADLSHFCRKPGPNEPVVLYAVPDRFIYNMERELPVLTNAEEHQYAKDLGASMGKEWSSWKGYESFVPISKSKVFNTIDARWVHKFKIVDGERIIKRRF